MRKIAIVTGARSDFGIYLPILKLIEKDKNLQLELFVTGTHLSPFHGRTIAYIEKEGFAISEKVEISLSSDSPEGIGKSMGLGLIGFSQVFSRNHPDILVVLGDRFEMFSAALSSLPFAIPIAHIHGGEVTEGAIDEVFRHAMTKMSHLHFVSTAEYGRRIHQMGEENWRITVSGAPGLDNIKNISFLSRKELEKELAFPLSPPPLLFTYHPVTLETDENEAQIEEVFAALEQCKQPIIFTMPNADTKNYLIRRKINEFVQNNSNAKAFESLGTKNYFSLMKVASAMIGNSSSGIIEAPSFQLPVVNIGNRQAGRVRAENVLDVSCNSEAIQSALWKALEIDFKNGLKKLVNPYGTGNAAQIIVNKLKSVKLNEKLIKKKFVDLN